MAAPSRRRAEATLAEQLVGALEHGDAETRAAPPGRPRSRLDRSGPAASPRCGPSSASPPGPSWRYPGRPPPAREAALDGLGRGQRLGDREADRHVDAHAARGRLLDRPDAGRGGGNFTMMFGASVVKPTPWSSIASRIGTASGRSARQPALPSAVRPERRLEQPAPAIDISSTIAHASVTSVASGPFAPSSRTRSRQRPGPASRPRSRWSGWRSRPPRRS